MDITETRPLENQTDWESYVRLRNLVFSHNPSSVEHVKELDAHRPKGTRGRRFLVTQKGEDRATCVVVDNHWSTSEGAVMGFAWAPDQALYGGAFSKVVEVSIEFDAKSLTTWSRSDREFEFEYLSEVGFEIRQTNPECKLDLHEFEPEQFKRHLPVGLEIIPYRELGVRFPEDWKHLAWRLEMDIMADVPLPQPFQETPFETFREMLDSPMANHDSCFMALDAGRPVGLSQLTPNKVDPRVVSTGLTGVLQSHRRLGLAQNLKAAALSWAKDSGARSVFTDNEENNPMYALNVKLGFKKIFDSICLEKSMG